MGPWPYLILGVVITAGLIVALLAAGICWRYRVQPVRYRLRTLLTFITIVCVLLTLLGRLQTECGTTINGSQSVAVKASAISGGVALDSDGKIVNATIGNLPVSVDAKQVVIAGRRTVPLPAAWGRVELTRDRYDVQIVVDGARLPPAP